MEDCSKQFITDSFERRLRYLRLSVTDLCNYKCQYCLPDGYQGKKPRNELSLSEISHLVKGFAQLGTEKIRLTGGEPTLRRDITDIIHTCKHAQGIQKVAITTNGWRLDRFYQQWVDAGLDQINISIDSLRDETFAKITGKDSLTSILHAIDGLLDQRIAKIKVNAVLHKEYGMQQLNDALAFVKDKPVSFRFIELMQTGDNNPLFTQSFLTCDTIVSELATRGWIVRDRQQDAGPAVEFEHPDYIGRIGVIAPYSKDFCTTCNRLRVTPQGNMHLCLFDSQAFDIRPFLVAGKEEALKLYIKRLVAQKPKAHQLKQQHVGLITTLSMIGG